MPHNAQPIQRGNGDGVCARALANGMTAIRVDGGDARAVYHACSYARKQAAEVRVSCCLGSKLNVFILYLCSFFKAEVEDKWAA
eukprot:scaffold101375_cov18-Tisochrysis_lutea.AAC.1